ncbi:thioredoxin family protein [Sulfurimonas sp.]|nr:thioredoxin family protein [Sulfurimonas sp.]
MDVIYTEYQVVSTPDLVIDGKVVITSKLLTVDEGSVQNFV